MSSGTAGRYAGRFGVRHITVARWAARYRQRGAAGVRDRFSRPHHRPSRTPSQVDAHVIALRRAHHITVARWAARYRQRGAADMRNRSSRPHHRPRQTPSQVGAHVIALRRAHHTATARWAARAGVAPSTVHRILTRHGMSPPNGLRPGRR
ncbi:helix-turn-helix domain-containing protein [Actinoallomurus acaciae]|uniref:Helix-turn-helix domain-containing protein n=1 Tax=Actinoallomurus acaciae TaxID=502577 RepID=A0ABV5YUA7_9ACTN